MPEARAVCALLLAVLLGACSGIPTRSEVRRGPSVGVENRDPYVRVLPPPPPAGATPQEVVRGFLLASADFERDHATAREYLSPGARERWQAGAGVEVLDSDVPYELVARGSTVTLTGTRVGTIDREGRYSEWRGKRALRRTFTLRRDRAGQWRIVALPDGLHLPSYEIRRVFRRVNLYFLAPGEQRVVPDPVLVPEGPGLASAVATRLLRGPTRWLAPAVTTAFPAGTALAGAVPVENGVARVDLNAAAGGAEPDQRGSMSAQLVWTLRQLDVTGVRISVGGAALAVPGTSGEVQAVDQWQGYDPGVLPRGPRAYLVRGGRVGSLEGEVFTPLAGAAGSGRRPLRRPALSQGGDLVAGLAAPGTLLAGRVGERDLPVRLRGADLGAPSFDPAGTVWVLDRGQGRGTLWALPPRGGRARVELPRTGTARVTAARVARDGTRVAVVLTRGRVAQLHVGVVSRVANRLRVPALACVGPAFAALRDLGWQDEDSVAVLAAPEGGVLGAYAVAVDGLGFDSLGTLGDARSLAAAPAGAPLLVATPAGVYEAAPSGRSFAFRGRGADPFYPG